MLGIVPGDETEQRGVTVPAIGDEYIDSHHKILEVTEKYTVYFADTQATLPNPSNYDTLLGIAETTHDDISGKTVHLHDGSQWVDTYAEPADETVSVRDDVDAFEEYVSIEDYESLEEVAGTVDTTTETITDIQNQISDVDVQEDIVTWFDTELSNTVGDHYADTDDTIRGDITTLENDFETAVGSDYIDNSPTNIDERLATISEKISCIQDHIEDADFEPNITSTPDNNTIEPGETATFEAEITNTGHKSGSQTITLNADDSQVDSQEVNSLCGDVNTDQPSISNTETVSLEWTPSESDAGSTDVTVETGDRSSATVTITVKDPNPDLSIDSFNVVNNDHYAQTDSNSLEVDVTISNTGGDGDAAVWIVDKEYDMIRATSTKSISSGESTTVTVNFKWQYSRETIKYKVATGQKESHKYYWHDKSNSFNIDWKAPIKAKINGHSIYTQDGDTFIDLDVTLKNRSDESFDTDYYSTYALVDDVERATIVGYGVEATPTTISSNSSISTTGEWRHIYDKDDVTEAWVEESVQVISETETI